jgi:hypothetical protein
MRQRSRKLGGVKEGESGHVRSGTVVPDSEQTLDTSRTLAGCPEGFRAGLRSDCREANTKKKRAMKVEGEWRGRGLQTFYVWGRGSAILSPASPADDNNIINCN